MSIKNVVNSLGEYYLKAKGHLLRRVLPFILATGVTLGGVGVASAGASQIQKGEEHKKSVQQLALKHFGISKYFGNNDDYKADLWGRFIDKDNLKLTFSGSYDDKTINFKNDRGSDFNQNLKLCKVGLDLYKKLPTSFGRLEFLTLEAGYEHLGVDLNTIGTIVSEAGIPLSADGSQNGIGDIYSVALGGKINLSPGQFIYLKGHAKKVDGNIKGDELGPSAQLFKGVDDSPLVYGGYINFSDRLILTYHYVEPETGEPAQIYVAKIPVAINIGHDKKIVNAFLYEYLRNYFDKEDQERFTDIFWLMTRDNKRLLGFTGSYKSDGDWSAELKLPLIRLRSGGNIALTMGYSEDHYKGYDPVEKSYAGVDVQF